MQEAIFTSNAPTPRGFYSQGVKAGPLLFIAGMLPVDHEGKLVGGTAGDQTRRAMSYVAAVAEAAGGSLASLTQVTIYVSDIAEWPEVNSAYKELMADAPVPPARAVVPVAYRPRTAAVSNKLRTQLSGWDNDLWLLQDWTREA